MKAFLFHGINEHLKTSAPGLKEPAREAIARTLALKLAHKLDGNEFVRIPRAQYEALVLAQEALVLMYNTFPDFRNVTTDKAIAAIPHNLKHEGPPQ